MSGSKLDHALQSALDGGAPGPFPIVVRFTHPVSQADTASLGLTAGGDMASGVATRDQIDALAARVDVVKITLVRQPKTN
jgi:hypothetical protein